MSGEEAPDLDALLVALVLAPATYSRNRFFKMYTDPAVRRVRRRAALVRSVVRHLVEAGDAAAQEPVSAALAEAKAGPVELTYSIPSLGLRRTTLLEPMEAALVRFAIARSQGRGGPASPEGPIDEGDPDRLQIEAALRRLAPFSQLGHHAGRLESAPHDPIV